MGSCPVLLGGTHLLFRIYNFFEVPASSDLKSYHRATNDDTADPLFDTGYSFQRDDRVPLPLPDSVNSIT